MLSLLLLLLLRATETPVQREKRIANHDYRFTGNRPHL